jgi:uncharacterized membrane protein YhiD involved in acid resistance
MNIEQLIQQLFDPNAQAIQPLDAFRVAVALIITFFLSVIIIQVYKYTQKRSFLSQNFASSLVLVSMVTAMIIMPISTNIVLSLGMVGALSIVRFRTAMKDPMDIAFLFWAIACGISNGAGFYNVSLVGTLIIALIMILYGRVAMTSSQQFLIVLRYHPSINAQIQEILPPCRLLSQIMREDAVELTLELENAKEAHKIPPQISQIPGVFEASVVNYNGEHLPT